MPSMVLVRSLLVFLGSLNPSPVYPWRCQCSVSNVRGVLGVFFFASSGVVG